MNSYFQGKKNTRVFLNDILSKFMVTDWQWKYSDKVELLG